MGDMRTETHRCGPYQSNGGHYFYSVRYSDGTRTSLSAHREIMSAHVGRPLTEKEVVHHRNGDPTDNRIENLELLADAAAHLAVHRKPAKRVDLICIFCHREFERSLRTEKYNRKQGKKGPYCGRSCAAKAQIEEQGCVRGTRRLEEYHEILKSQPTISINKAASLLKVNRNTIINYKHELGLIATRRG